jgi:hypothetical protein
MYFWPTTRFQEGIKSEVRVNCKYNCFSIANSSDGSGNFLQSNETALQLLQEEEFLVSWADN